MSTTYYEDTASSGLNLNTVTAPANSTKLLQTAAGSASSLTITLASSATANHFWITEPGDPGSLGGTPTSFTIAVTVTTANMNLSATGSGGTGIAWLQRLNSS